MSIITIVGAGMMGSAMCFPAVDNGHEVRLVGIHNRENIDSVLSTGYHPTLKTFLPSCVKAYHIEDLKTALEGADLVISGVSSFGVHWFEENVLPLLPDGAMVLCVTKGMEADREGNLVTFPDAMMSRCGRNIDIAAIGGPVISFELADRQQTEIAFCGHNMEHLQYMKSLLATEYYHITLTEDVAGLECAVAMKNAYAAGVALAIGKNAKERGDDAKEKYNPQAALFEQSTREVMKIMDLVKAQKETLVFFAGDLYVTVFGGRTRRLGVLLGKGHSYPEAREILAGVTLESVEIITLVSEAFRKLEAQGRIDTNDFPLLMLLDGVINQGRSVDIPWKSFEQICRY